MQAPTVVEALAAWERGTAGGAVERGLELFGLARPGTGLDLLADVSMGGRDAALLELRETLFGPELTGRLACEGCGDEQETVLRLGDLRIGGPVAGEIALDTGGYALRLRPPNSRDLLAAAGAPLAQARRILFERCVLSAVREGAPVANDQLPADIVEDVARALAEADPQADLQLTVACASCGHGSRLHFDIGAFLWEEIEAWAARLLQDVHALAAFYGWSERDILEMSPVRRRRYLELAGG